MISFTDGKQEVRIETEWSDLDGDSDPVKDVKDLLEQVREAEGPTLGIDPAHEHPTHVLRHECGHVVGYYRVWLPRKYRRWLRSRPCHLCREGEE